MRLRRPNPRRALPLLLAALWFAGTPVRGEEGLARVEADFHAAARAVTPATVILTPRGVAPARAGFSSGVLVSADGLVLSDGDAGVRFDRTGGREVREWRDDIDVRVPAGPAGGYRTYQGRVLHRARDADTALVRILRPPPGGFPHVRLGRSDDLRVGDFAIAVGTAFDEAGRAPPTLTAGVIASFEPLPPGSPGGRHAFLYTSAGVNQGVNGGPLVDLSGRLVGTVSTYVDPTPDAVHQFLGKVVPVDRLRSVYRTVAAARALFDRRPPDTVRTGHAGALATVFSNAARRASSSVVSLRVERLRRLSRLAPLGRRDVTVPRYEGPVSGVLISADGWVVTSLYNLTNVGSLVEPVWGVPPGASLEEGLADISRVTAHLGGGAAAPARLVAHDRRLGIALIKVDLTGAAARARPPVLRPLEPAPEAGFEAGRFVLAVGNPFGSRPHPEPFLTVGILSRFHPPDTAAAWRGQWLTDAAGLDTNCGGAAVDLEGRLLGVLTIWHPARHGRSSGVAFVVPWRAIEKALPRLKLGQGPERGFLGVRFGPGEEPRVEAVIAGTAAEQAGLRVGDVLLRIDREDVPTTADAVAVIGYRCRDDVVEIMLERAGSLRTLTVRLGPRP